jgi:hypothetical protein
MTLSDNVEAGNLRFFVASFPTAPKQVSRKEMTLGLSFEALIVKPVQRLWYALSKRPSDGESRTGFCLPFQRD